MATTLETRPVVHAGEPAAPRSDLPRTLLGVAVLSAMILGTIWILRPFLGAVLWAATVVVATWPIMLGLQARLGGRRAPAVAVMTGLLLLVLIFPLTVAVGVVVSNIDVIQGWGTSLGTFHVPAPPPWLDDVPVVGRRVAAMWQDLASEPGGLAARVQPHARMIALWLVSLVGGLAGMAVQFLLVVVIAAILYARGEATADFACRFASRLAGAHGERSVILAGRAVRGVALGIVVTALIQAFLSGIGLAVAGVPFAALLTAVIIILTIAQIGPVPILVSAVVWLYWWKGDAVWGSLLLVWTIFVASLDNVIRPFLIRKGADLPLLLIFAGVLGGMLGFGIIGIFIGPVVLAVTYTLLVDWVKGGEQPRDTP
jgi:predicted PurR-regulated permease PerM